MYRYSKLGWRDELVGFLQRGNQIIIHRDLDLGT